MCGIAGIFGPPVSKEELSADIRGMITPLAHRGPDGEGVWVDAEVGIGLAHRRLAIIDLSTEGAQPMVSACGRYVLVFNGEIYNFLELRDRLVPLGAVFRGQSDTEVMLAAFSVWGVRKALPQFYGMFAFALWDRSERKLCLGRDRLGKKPFYFVHMKGRLLFGSELKALKAVSGWSSGIEPAAASAYFRYGFVPGDLSMLRGVRKVPPGHVLELRSPTTESAPEAYWTFEEVASASVAKPFKGDYQEAEQELATLLIDAVRIRRRADVPLGAFLSGGIDSSLVVALMQEAGGDPVRTFTIGFVDSEYDESASAAEVAQALGCRHTLALLEPAELVEIAPTLSTVYDEPFADVSQVPTLLVSRLARREVTVCLSGDGGDELFGGYHRHFLAARFWPVLLRIPLPLRHVLATGVRRLGQGRLASLLGGGIRSPDNKVSKALGALESNELDDLYRTLLSQDGWRSREDSHTLALRWRRNLPVGLGVAREMMAMDTLCYLPDDILVKVDRASMAVSLELRCPLLDHRLLEFSWRLPDTWLVDRGRGKSILRRLLGRYLPREMFERPKMGFAVPIGDWLRGPLRLWAEDILLTGAGDVWLPTADIRIRWHRHMEGREDHGHWLWRALTWRAWRTHWCI